MINFSWFTFKIIYVDDYLQGKIEKSMNMNMAERHQIQKEKKKIHLETYLLFLWESILLVLHIELDKVQHVLSFVFPWRLRWLFLWWLFWMETYCLNLCLVYYCSVEFMVVVFLIGLFWKPFRRRPRMNLMALFMLFWRAGSFCPAKWKSYLGKHNIDWHIFSQISGNGAMRLELPDQDSKAIESAISAEMHTA